MGLFDGKVAIVTGAGRGIGRSHALLLAPKARRSSSTTSAAARAAMAPTPPRRSRWSTRSSRPGGRAVANYDSVSSWAGAEQMVQQAVDAFGGLDVLINNAGILRDKMSFNMDEAEWDSVIDVHLKGHFAPSRFAACYWRAKSKETGEPVNAKIVNTASESGLYGNAGQANYAAAKAGIASMTIVMARELERIGVRVNAIAPVARTRLTEQVARRLHEPQGRRVRPLRAREHLGRRRLARVRSLRRRDRSGGEGHGRPGPAAARLAAGHRSDRRQAVDDRRDRRSRATRCSPSDDKGVPPFMPNIGDA